MRLRSDKTPKRYESDPANGFLPYQTMIGRFAWLQQVVLLGTIVSFAHFHRYNRVK